MRIAFDHQAFCLQRTGGVSRYFCELARAMQQPADCLKIFAPVYRNVYLSELPRTIVRGIAVTDYPPYTASICTSLNGRLASALIESWQPDIIHETYYSNRRSGSKKAPTVLSVFDMISELGLMGDTCSSADLKSSPKYQAVHRADHVICISHSTQRDLIRLFDVPSAKTSVIHLGCDAFHANEAQKVDRTYIGTMGQPKPYLLYVGLRGAYKNFARLLEAYANSKRLSSDFNLVAFGSAPFTTAETAKINALGLSLDQVQHSGGSDDDLVQLYRNASAFVYPSLYEGFGLPPLEAMAQGCPVVSSNTSSMPEVIGDAAEYFDPHQADYISAAIERVVYSSERREDLILKGRLRSSMFDWARCASETRHLYQTIVSGSK